MHEIRSTPDATAAHGRETYLLRPRKVAAGPHGIPLPPLRARCARWWLLDRYGDLWCLAKDARRPGGHLELLNGSTGAVHSLEWHSPAAACAGPFVIVGRGPTAPTPPYTGRQIITRD